jgi:Cu2+-exporting ATPase
MIMPAIAMSCAMCASMSDAPYSAPRYIIDCIMPMLAKPTRLSAAALHARWSLDAGAHEHVVFLADGIRCAGCARSIEKALRALPEVEAVAVNLVNARVSVDWRGGGRTGLAQILAAVEGAGFRPVPLAGEAASADFQRERRAALKRVGFASLGMMQAMMYLGALYGASDIDAAMAALMRISGLVIVTPVLV